MVAVVSSLAPQAPEDRRDARADPPFESILFDGPVSPTGAPPPECFHDLGLDQIVEAVVAPWKDCDLTAFFRVPLATEDAVVYRQSE